MQKFFAKTFFCRLQQRDRPEMSSSEKKCFAKLSLSLFFNHFFVVDEKTKRKNIFNGRSIQSDLTLIKNNRPLATLTKSLILRDWF